MTKKANNPIKLKKAPQAPRRFKSAYMFFSTGKHKEIRSGMAIKIPTTEVAKLVSKAWKAMEKTERDKWDALATRDKARYEIEKSTYKGPWKVAVTGRLAKDPKAPKRPMSAFLSFSSAKRSDVKELYPNIPNSEVSKLLSSWWRDAPKEEKRSYIDKELKLRQQYKVQTQTWKRKTTDAFNAARQAREDEALRVFDSGEPEPVTSNEGKEQYQACTAQPSPPNAPQNSEIAAPNCYYDGQPSRNVHWGPAQNNPVVSPENERSTYMVSVDPFPDQLQPLSYPDQLQPLSYSNQREADLYYDRATGTSYIGGDYLSEPAYFSSMGPSMHRPPSPYYPTGVVRGGYNDYPEQF